MGAEIEFSAGTDRGVVIVKAEFIYIQQVWNTRQTYEPKFHVHVSEKLAWLRLTDDLPRYTGSKTD